MASPIILQTGGGNALLIVWAVLIIAWIAGTWKAFQKADQPGWAAIIPIYNFYIMLKIADMEWWWLLVILFVPLVNLYGMYKMHKGVATSFGQGIGFALGLWFLGFIFWPLLGFGDYTHQGSPA